MTNLHRLGVLAATAAVGSVLALSTAAPAGAAVGPTGSAVATPVRLVDGRTGGQLLGQRWYRRLQKPAQPTGSLCLHLGRTGRVVVSLNGQTCTVEQGTIILVAPLTSICSPLDPPHATGRQGQLRCARNELRQSITGQTVTVDGGRTVDVRGPQFAAASPQRTVTLPKMNVYGVPPQTITFTAFGWVAVVRHLSPGLHTISTHFAFADGSTDVAREKVRIVSDDGVRTPPG